MIQSGAELALGTAQFGLAYGIAGRGEPVPDREIRAILERAAASGVRRIDTAAAYGDIEERLAGLAHGLEFEMVSKIAALPAGADADAVAVAVAFAVGSIERSRARLGESLRGILFHGTGDLMGERGASVWEASLAAAERMGVALGVSGYAPADLVTAPAVAMAQLPGNAFDQRLADAEIAGGAEISVRSIFLQGLLLMPHDAAVRRLPAAREALDRWQRWCADRGETPLAAAIGVAKGLPHARYCIVGIDDADQFEGIATCWRDSAGTAAPELAVQDQDVIDPRRWVVQ